MTPGLIVAMVVVLVIGIWIIAVYNPQPTLDELPDGAEAVACVACGSRQLEHPAPGAYLCRDCGFEGGADRGELERKERQLAWSLKPWPERLDAARADLDEARMLLLGVEGELSVLARYLDVHDPLRTEVKMIWAKIALTTLDLVTERGLEERRRPNEFLRRAYDEVLEESDRAWGALRRAEEKVPELSAGPALPHQKLDLGGRNATGQSITVTMQVFHEVSERYQRALQTLQRLDAEHRRQDPGEPARPS